MKDNDLLVTKMYQDKQREAITALSVFMSPGGAGTERALVRDEN